MRLIDADELIASLNDWRKNWEESEDSYEKTWTLTAIDFMTSLVDEKKTAYDVEAVIAELEKKAEEYNEKADRYSVHEDYFMRYLSIAKGIEKAISIVRGKERKYCGNCKHQPEPFTTCEWLKSQTQIIKECPRWERKE